MDQRFTIKDFLLFCALGIVFVTVLLAMYMVDRQWDKMAQMQKIMHEQASDLRSFKRTLASLRETGWEGRAAGGDGMARGPAANDTIPAAFRRAFEATQKPDYSAGDWKVQAFGVNLKSITPFVSEDAYSAEIQSHVLESLLIRNPGTLDWEGLIARSWKMSDTGLTIVFQMREEAKFSDGHPIEASDVAFTFEFIMDPAIRAPRERSYYSKIESVRAAGSHRVVFHFKEPYYDALALAGEMPILPKHFYAPYLKEANAFNQSKGLLLGSGQYRLADPKGWTPDKGSVELHRNPRYWGFVQPSLDRLLWKVIANDSARLTTFRNGEIDVYGARPREYQRLRDEPALTTRARHEAYMSPTGGYSYIGWNERRGNQPTRFADKRVRQAMTYLTDRKRIIDEIYLGYAEPAIGPFNPLGRQHSRRLKARPYDPEKARALLQQSGFEDRDGDGVLEGAKGRPFEFDFIFFQGSEDTKRLVLFLKDLYARAGILVRPKPTEWSVMLDVLKQRDFDAITLGWTGSIESDLYQIFHSSQIADGGNNYIGYRNEKLDTIIEQARGTVDEQKRMPLWHEAEALLYEDQPYTFLVRRKSLVFIDRRFHNLQKTKLGLNLNAVPEEIYVPVDRQKYRE